MSKDKTIIHAKRKGVGTFCVDSVDQKVERVVLIEIEYQILIPNERTESYIDNRKSKNIQTMGMN